MHHPRPVSEEHPMTMPRRLTDFRIFSTTFGRPLLINNELIHIDLPLDVELEQLPKDHSHAEVPSSPEPRSSVASVFIPSMYGLPTLPQSYF